MGEARRSLANIGGIREKMTGVVRAEPGTLVVVLKNGKPVRILKTGKSAKRGWRAPLLGDLSVMPISTAAHVVDLDIENVGTLPDHVSPIGLGVPRVTVTFEIQLRNSDASSWVELKNYIDEQGDNFAQRLLPRVKSELADAVRDALAKYTYEQIYRANITHYIPRSGLILKDLFEIIAVVDARMEPNPSYESVVQVKEGAIVDQADLERSLFLTNGQVQVDRRAALGQSGTEELVALGRSQLTGRTLDELLNGDRSALDQTQILELMKALIDNPHALSNPQLREVVERASSAMGAPALVPGAAVVPVGAGPAGGPLLTPELVIDTRIAPAFEALGLAGSLLGASWARRPDSCVVACVSNDPSTVLANLADLVQSLSLITKSETSVFVTPYAPELPTVVGEYLSLRLPDLSNSRSSLQARVVDGRLEIVLDPSDVESNGYRSIIRDPKTLILEPLKRMLPYDSIDVVPS